MTGEVTAMGVTRMLEVIRQVNPKGAFLPGFQQRNVWEGGRDPKRETTPFYPRSPYGVAKVYGHWITVNYRESYNHVCGLGHPIQS